MLARPHPPNFPEICKLISSLSLEIPKNFKANTHLKFKSNSPKNLKKHFPDLHEIAWKFPYSRDLDVNGFLSG